MGLRAPPPSLRLPRTGRPFTRSIAASALLHLGAVGVMIWTLGRADSAAPPAPGWGPGSGGGGERRLTFVALTPPAPAAPVATRPRIETPPLPTIHEIPVRVQPADLLVEVPVSVTEALAAAGARGGTGSGGGVGSGSGTGVGPGRGPGLGGVGDYFPPTAHYAILPPLPKPAAVRGKSFKVHFWVDARGRVTKVEVSPEIPDGAYRRKFLELMYEYTFAPARRADGTPVAGETIITVTL